MHASNTNRRLKGTRTVYHDDADRRADSESFDFDGLGHYRKVDTDGTFAAGNVRSTFTDYNDARGTHNPNGDPGSPADSFTMLPAGSPWVINTFDEQTATEGGVTARQTFCFDANNGSLLRRRTHKAATGRNASDLLAVFTVGSSGNVSRERYFGGDGAGVSTSADLCGLALPTLQYDLEHKYSFGTRRKTEYKNGAAVELLVFDRTIDSSTGLVKTSADAAGFTTTFTYDTSGRLESETPDSGAQTIFTYTNPTGDTASPADNARVTIERKAQPGGALLAREEIVFDDLGRVMEEKRDLPGSVVNRRRTEYNARGWKTRVYELEDDVTSATHFTEFKDHDPFGRPGTITPPDGASHDVDLVYTGVSRVERTVRIETDGVVGESPATTTEIYDRQGRLHQVIEPVGDAGTSATTTYTYDEGNRLASVAMAATHEGQAISQARSFDYDRRGLLVSESHPEKEALVLYSDYDARGHAGRKRDGTSPSKSDLTFTFDRAERLTQVEETGGQVLKEFAYGTANVPATNLVQGKLQSATRHNVLEAFSSVDLQIREVYEYQGVGGRVSKREIRRTSGAVNDEKWFEQSFSWTQLGDVDDLTYPTCTIQTECTGGGNPSGQPSRTVVHEYDDGFLTEVTGYASSIGYHPNEMLSSVAHTNGVTDLWDADASAMRRPSRIRTTGVTGGSNFDTGSYLYDGAGNVKAMGADTFTYDAASRLTYGTSNQGQTSESSRYDPFGNRIHAASTAGGSRAMPTDPSTNRLLGKPSRPVSYDSRGNVILWGTADYSYDELDSLIRQEDPRALTTDDDVDLSYVYTADDERIVTIRKPPPTPPGLVSSETWTLRDLDGLLVREFFRVTGDTDWVKDTIHRQRQVLATEDGTGRRDAHLDHLGTIRLWTREEGSSPVHHTYHPFGEEVFDTQDGQELRFTGHERDLYRSPGCSGTKVVDGETLDMGVTIEGCDAVTSENTTVTSPEEVRFRAGGFVGLGEDFSVTDSAVFVVELDADLNTDLQDLDYMHARYCSPWWGRFLSVDPVQQTARAMQDPQAWNRYSYALNSPLKYVDPTGQIIVLFEAGSIGGAMEELSALQESLVEAGAFDEAQLLQLEEIDGEIQITAGGADLAGSSNETAAAVGRAIARPGRIEFGITNRSDPAFVARGGAVTSPLDLRDPTSVRIEINPAVQKFTIGKIIGGVLAGRRVISGFSLGTKVMHEIGHANASLGSSTVPAMTNDSALRQENEHRRLSGRQEAWIRRLGHD